MYEAKTQFCLFKHAVLAVLAFFGGQVQIFDKIKNYRGKHR